MSGDEGDIWREHKEERNAKKLYNTSTSLQVLRDRGIAYQTLNAAVCHYRVGDFDFWPSTGKFYNQKTGEKGRGVFNLIKRLCTKNTSVGPSSICSPKTKPNTTPNT